MLRIVAIIREASGLAPGGSKQAVVRDAEPRHTGLVPRRPVGSGNSPLLAYVLPDGVRLDRGVVVLPRKIAVENQVGLQQVSSTGSQAVAGAVCCAGLSS